MDLSLLSALNAERAGRRAAILLTDTATGEARLVRESEPRRTRSRTNSPSASARARAARWKWTGGACS
jgi:hypothetical protein